MNKFQKKIKDKIKIYSDKEYFDGYLENEFLTDDEDADIYLNLSDIDELIDSRTSGRQIELTSDFYEYVESKSSILDNNVQIDLHIKGLDISSKQQGMIKHIVKEHYGVELYKAQKEYNKIKRKVQNLFAIGFVTALLYFSLEFFTDFELGFLLEVLSFTFSFSLWEAFDAMLYTLSELRYEREATAQNLLMNITFE